METSLWLVNKYLDRRLDSEDLADDLADEAARESLMACQALPSVSPRETETRGPVPKDTSSYNVLFLPTRDVIEIPHPHGQDESPSRTS